MKIKRIDVFQADLTYSNDKYLLSGGRTYRSFDATVARLETDDGWVGWGESTPFGATWVAAHALGVRAGIAEIAPALIGLDPRRVDRINDAMDQTLVGHPHAKTVVDGHVTAPTQPGLGAEPILDRLKHVASYG